MSQSPARLSPGARPERSWPGLWPEPEVCLVAPGLAHGAWPLSESPQLVSLGRVGCRSPEICCSPTTACHPPRYYSNPHYRETSSHSNATAAPSATQPRGETGHLLELPERTVRAAWGERVDVFGSFLRGVQPFLDVNIFSPSSSRLLLSSLPIRIQLIVYSRPVPATN